MNGIIGQAIPGTLDDGPMAAAWTAMRPAPFAWTGSQMAGNADRMTEHKYRCLLRSRAQRSSFS